VTCSDYANVDVINQKLLQSHYSVPHSLYVTKFCAENFCPKNDIQNGGRRHLEFISGGYF